MLETQGSKSNIEIISENSFPNLYTQTYGGMTIGKILKTKE